LRPETASLRGARHYTARSHDEYASPRTVVTPLVA